PRRVHEMHVEDEHCRPVLPRARQEFFGTRERLGVIASLAEETTENGPQVRFIVHDVDDGSPLVGGDSSEVVAQWDRWPSCHQTFTRHRETTSRLSANGGCCSRTMPREGSEAPRSCTRSSPECTPPTRSRRSCTTGR